MVDLSFGTLQHVWHARKLAQLCTTARLHGQSGRKNRHQQPDWYRILRERWYVFVPVDLFSSKKRPEFNVYRYYATEMTGYRVATTGSTDCKMDSYAVVGNRIVRILVGGRVVTGGLA